jgi:DNA-binding response OmpR family regulator
VLLVEDDLGVAQIQMLALKLAGIPVDRVSTVAEGRTALATSGYSLCIFDHHLPDGHGTELVTYVRELLNSDMPVIVVSGARQAAHVARTYALGATEYISKPFSPSDLTTAVQRLL